jgi:hypothetical protein
MQIPFNLINDFASVTGIGALCLLGIFLIVDGRQPKLFPTIEFYAQTKTWALVAVIPVFAIAYVVGLFSVVIMEPIGNLLFGQLSSDVSEFENLSIISFLESELLSQEFTRLMKETRLLYGSAFAFILIGIGGFSEIRNLPRLKKIIIIASISAVVVSGAAMFAGTQKRIKSTTLVISAVKVDRERFNEEKLRQIELRREVGDMDNTIPKND